MTKCKCGHEKIEHHNAVDFCCDITEAGSNCFCETSGCHCEDFSPKGTGSNVLPDGLLPCPFCGGESKQFYNHEEGEYVACIDCNIHTAGYGNPAEAIADWNTRANPVGSLRSQLSEAEAVIDHYAEEKLRWDRDAGCEVLASHDSLEAREYRAKYPKPAAAAPKPLDVSNE